MDYLLTIGTLIGICWYISQRKRVSLSHRSLQRSSPLADEWLSSQHHFSIEQATALLAYREKYYLEQEARRLNFARYLVEQGYLSEDC